MNTTAPCVDVDIAIAVFAARDVLIPQQPDIAPGSRGPQASCRLADGIGVFDGYGPGSIRDTSAVVESNHVSDPQVGAVLIEGWEGHAVTAQ